MLPRLILFRGFITPRHGDRKCMEKEEHATEHRQLSCQESSSTTFYPNKVFIRNVAPCVSRELLVSYLENVTGQTHIDLLYSDEPGDVLATFTRRIDFEKVKKRCQSKLLNERQLGVWRVPVSNSILVENLSPESDPEHVSCYFETPRANGGTVLEVKPTPDENKFIVVFKDAKTTEGVLKATHRLGGRELRVSLYLECLGPSGGRTEPYIFVPPPPVEVTEADDLKVCFLRYSADMLQSFNESLLHVHGQATVEGHVLRVDCTLTGSMHRVDLMAGRWRENVKRQLTICFDSIRLQRIAVHPEIWENVKKAVEESEVSCSDLILTFEEECSFVVLGRCNTKTVAFEQIQSIIKVKTEECELKKLEVSDTKKVRKHHLELVKSSSFLSDIRTLHTGLTVDISLEHGEITLQGQPMAIRDAQVRMYDLIHSFSTKVVTSIPQAQRDLLATEKSHDAVRKRLEASGLTAAWECHSEAIVVYNLNKHWLDPAAGIIETSFKSEILFFNKLSSRVFEESQWDSQKKMLVREYHGLLEISRQKSSIYITSFCDIMPAVKGAIRTFISENTIYTAVLELSPSRQKYLALFWEEKILPTAQKFAQYKVHITLQDDNRSILIRGTYKGVELVKEEFISLSDQIICKEESITRPETVRYIAALKTTKELEAIACTCKCVVSLHPEKCEIKTLSTNQPSGSPQVYAVTGDITQLAVDAVVNAANSLMDHAGGLAGQVVAKGGQEIQEECYRILKTRGKLSEGDVLVSGPGKLPCKSIIHAVGPRYKGGNKGEEECLQATVMECLKTASDLGYTSIALPAISSGIFGYPVREATRVIVEAVTSFFSANHDTSIRDVRLVDIVTSTVRHFQTALYTIQKRNKFFPNQQAAWTIGDAVAEGLLTTMSPNQPCDSPNIKAVIADITQLSVDAIVNAANEEMNHVGGLAGQVVAKGGQEIQEECSRILRVKGKLSEGDVLVSGPGKLPCKSIIHAVGPRYKGGNKGEEECLQATVMECLKTASNLGCTSIAFPAISSGNFGYPVGAATRVIVEAVTSFFSANHDTSIRDVRLVDIVTSTVQHFQTALDTMGERNGFLLAQKAAWTFGDAVTEGMPTTMSPNQPCDSPNIKAVIADITQLSVDAIVNAANEEMNHAGGLGGHVVAKGGQEIQEECSRILKVRGKLSEGDVLVSGPGKLPCKSIIHAVGPRYKGGNNGEEECLRNTVMECLKTASGLRYTSIAFPAISSGNFGYPVGLATRVIVEAVTSFLGANHDTSIRDVRLVDIVSSTVEHFQTALDMEWCRETSAEYNGAEETSKQRVDYLQSSHSGRSPFFLSRKKTKSRDKARQFGDLHAEEISKNFTAEIVEATDFGVFSIDTIPVPQEVCKLYIYAANQEKIEEFFKELTNFVDEHVVKTEMKDFDKLSHDKLMEICKKHKVEVSMDTVITVKGMSKDVQLMEKEIQSILKEIESKQQASRIAGLVCWYTLEVTATGKWRVPFNERENLLTEDAYQKNEGTVEFAHTNGTVYVVNLKEMTRSSKVNPADSVKVIRNVKADWSSCSFLPETWDPQDNAELVKRVPLVKGCPEYSSVEANMMKTTAYPFNTSSTIISIERIQNPELYKQYLARKTHMDKQNNGMQSEKTLWHGTSSNAIDNINLYGFNRSFCGKNATCYGLGVYFAVNSWYSMQDTYSTRDFAGLKHMYQCKVLVGYSTNGYDGMKVLPKRYGNVQYDSATNNELNPSMYVIFHDSQAYPEYLITFR